MNMKLKLSLILLTLLFPYAIQSQQTNLPDTKTIELQGKIEAQNSRIQKLDSTITQLKNENAHLKDLAEQDIDHAKSLINVIEIILGFIAALLTIFTIVGGLIIRKLLHQRDQIQKDHQTLLLDWEKAQSDIENLKESSVREAKELLQILFYITEGDNNLKDRPDVAISLYKKALSIRKNNPEVYVKLGHANVEVGKYDDAINFLEKGIKLDSHNISILNGLGRAYRKSHQYDRAENYYKEALELDNENIWVLSGLGQIYIQKKDFDNAEIFYNKILSLDMSSTTLFNVGFVYLCKKDLKNAEYYFQKVISLIDARLTKRPNSRWALRLKALSLIGLSKFEEAKKILIELRKIGIFASQIRSIVDRLHVLYEITGEKKIEEIIKLCEDV